MLCYPKEVHHAAFLLALYLLLGLLIDPEDAGITLLEMSVNVYWIAWHHISSLHSLNIRGPNPTC